MNKLIPNEVRKSPKNPETKSILMATVDQYRQDKVDWTIEMLANDTGISVSEVTEILVYTSSADNLDSVASLIPSPEEAFSGDTFHTLET